MSKQRVKVKEIIQDLNKLGKDLAEAIKVFILKKYKSTI